MSNSLGSLVPWLRAPAAQLLALPEARGVRLSSVRRTRGVQAKLYRAYINGRSKYPAAPPGHSTHELGRAFDIVGSESQLRRLGAIWESWGGRWGGHFGDPIHFEA